MSIAGCHVSPVLTTIVWFAISDLLKACTFKQNEETSTLLFHTAFIQRHFGDHNEAMRFYQRAIEIDEKLGDEEARINSLSEIAKIYVFRGELDKGLELQKECLCISRNFDNKRGESTALYHMAAINLAHGEIDEATRLCKQSRKIYEKIGYRYGVCATLLQLGKVY